MSKRKPFKLVEYASIPGALFLGGPGELDLAVSYEGPDDLKAIRRAARKVVRILNEHWGDDQKKAKK